jgi:hypothetical protein
MIAFINTFYNLSQSQSITITHNQSTAEDSLHSCSHSHSDLIRFCTTYIQVLRRIHRRHVRCPAMDICEPHRKHLLCCQECVFIGLLSSNGSTCHNMCCVPWKRETSFTIFKHKLKHLFFFIFVLSLYGITKFFCVKLAYFNYSFGFLQHWAFTLLSHCSTVVGFFRLLHDH